jgi:hypothetical protein
MKADSIKADSMKADSMKADSMKADSMKAWWWINEWFNDHCLLSILAGLRRVCPGAR